MTLVRGVNHVDTITSDLDRLARFYCEASSSSIALPGRGLGDADPSTGFANGIRQRQIAASWMIGWT